MHLFGFQKNSKAITFDSCIGIQIRFHRWISHEEYFKTRSHMGTFWQTYFAGNFGLYWGNYSAIRKQLLFFHSMTDYQRKILLSRLSQLPKLSSFISKLYTITSKYPNSMPPQTFYRGNFECDRGNFSAIGKQLHFSLVGLRIRLVYGKKMRKQQ